MESLPPSARKCHCCNELFLPSPRSKATQRFCSAAACRKASKARPNQRWRAKNPGYSAGRKRPTAHPALQDLVIPQGPLVVGLIATMLGGALQESFVPIARNLVERGRRVLAQNRGGLGLQVATQT